MTTWKEDAKKLADKIIYLSTELHVNDILPDIKEALIVAENRGLERAAEIAKKHIHVLHPETGMHDCDYEECQYKIAKSIESLIT